MSEQYLVSARKYRPQTFDTVVGQEHITTTLKNAMRSGHLAHAFLFCGPRGVGKTSCARILAKTLNCEHPTADMEACGVCNNCRAFSDNTSFNVFELDAASNNSVDDIRELTDQVRFAPQQGKYKVYIIDEVHMLSSAAFNAFLKTLEEPPHYAIFILATTEKHKILPTILSRCQVFDFKRITTNDTVAHLQRIADKEHIQAEEEALHVIAQKSEGCMRDALSILDRIAGFSNGMLTYASTMEHLNQLDANFYFTITDFVLSGDVSASLLMLDEALERGFEGDMVLSGFAEHFRNLLLCKDARMAKLLDVPANQKRTYHEKANQMPPSFVLSALNVINDSELHYKTAGNKRLHTELCLIRLCYLLQATQAPEGDEKKNLERQRVNASPAPNPQPIPQAKPAEIPPPPPVNPQPANVSAKTEFCADEKTGFVQGGNAQDQGTPFAVPGSSSNVRRISKNMFQAQPAQQEAQTPQMDISELTEEKIISIIDQYKENLRSEQKSILLSSFENLKIEMPEPGIVHLISGNNIADSNIQAEKANLQELIKKETGLLVRLLNSFVQNDDEPKEKVLSKNEIFEQMAVKNPVLAQLRDTLKLSIS